MIRDEQAREIVGAAIEAIARDPSTAADVIYTSDATFEGPIGGPSLSSILGSIELDEFIVGDVGVAEGRAAFDFVIRGRDPLDIARKVGHGHVWWWFDDAGKVFREEHRIPWEFRRIDGTEPGSVVALSNDAGAAGAAAELATEPVDDEPIRRSPAWFREFKERLEQLTGWDPVLAVESFCTDGVMIGSPDVPSLDVIGREALTRFAEELVAAAPRGRRTLKIVDMIPGAEVMHLNLGYFYSSSRPEREVSDIVTSVMVIERDGRLRSCRLYGPWRGETLPAS